MVIGPGVTIADGAVIHSFSHIVQSSIGKKASVGPYARLRPGTSLGDGARIGNFVETKAATSKPASRSIISPTSAMPTVGANSNIGAGTITCNYDGFSKHKTTIGKGAFIGTNSSLVAPVKIGNGAYIGSGSVITKDVPDDAHGGRAQPAEQPRGRREAISRDEIEGKGEEGRLTERADALHVVASETVHPRCIAEPD